MNPVGLELVIVNEIERNDPYFRHVASLKSFLRIEAKAFFEVASFWISILLVRFEEIFI